MIAMAAPVGHHFIPQSIARGFNDLTRGLSNKITSGPLVDKWRNYYDGVHQAYNNQIKKVIDDYLEETGKTKNQLSASDIKAIIQRIKDSGGSIRQFLDRLKADASPTLRNIDQGFKNGMQESGMNDTVEAIKDGVGDPRGAIEETIEACESGGPCVPPL